MSAPTKPSIVFCHGIWADGSCFSKVIPPLQAEGYEVITSPSVCPPSTMARSTAMTELRCRPDLLPGGCGDDRLNSPVTGLRPTM